jgi:UDP-N-acetylmuramate--alanine ligase
MKSHRLHFVGIGGIGMSGIAEIFLSRGMRVSGSDLAPNETTERLVRMGAEVFSGHERSHVRDVDVVVISSAVKSDNPEVLEARSRGIPVIPRAEMLAEIMRGKTGIAVAGTHGKTTTTSMVAQILIHAGLDPTVVVGGKVESIGSNAKAGAGNLVVAEADESDGSFHLLPATFGVVTNIDADHMEYYQTREKLDEAFVRFVRQMPFYGRTWLCLEDAGVRTILPSLTKPFSTYGWGPDADLYAERSGPQEFTVFWRTHRNEPHGELGRVRLGVLGDHNVLNALGAIGVSLSVGAPFTSVQTALAEFKHVRRRFDERYHSPETGVRVIDDYGHHPTEIRAVLATARQTGHSRILTVFQPHRYTRTQWSWKEFLTCFAETDELILLPVYAASEEPIEGIDSETLARAIDTALGSTVKIRVCQSLDEAADRVMAELQPQDLVLTLGAGSITRLSGILASRLLDEKPASPVSR